MLNRLSCVNVNLVKYNLYPICIWDDFNMLIFLHEKHYDCFGTQWYFLTDCWDLTKNSMIRKEPSSANIRKGGPRTDIY